MTTPGRDADDLGRLQRRIDYLERELEQVERSNATSGLLAAGAAVMVTSLALPWGVAVGEAEFDESADIGWSAFGSDPLGLLLGLLVLLVVGLAAAASMSRSAFVSSAAYIAAVPLVLLLCLGLTRTEVYRPAVGYYTAFIAVVTVAVTAVVRRRQLRSSAAAR